MIPFDSMPFTMRSRFSTLLLAACAVFFVSSSTASVLSQCPDPEQTEVVYRGDGRRLPGVYSKLISCPNITSLNLDIGMEGCDACLEPEHFLFQEGDRFPALKKLSL